MPRAINVTNGHSLSEARRRLLEHYDAIKPHSWRSVALALGLRQTDAAMLSRIAQSKKRPQKPPDSVLRALGLPVARVVELQEGEGVGRACKSCGEVHTTKRCTAATKRPVRVRRLHELSDSEIRAAFENRKEIKTTHG